MIFRRSVDDDNAFVGVGAAREELVDERPQCRHFAPVFGDVRQIGVAARRDLMDLVNLGLYAVDELFPADN